MNIEITAAISELVNQLSEIYRENLNSSKASGTLQNFTTEIEVNEGKFSIIFNLEEYWKYVEYGRGPGKMPPIQSIENWISVKPIIPDAVNGKVPDTRQLAFLIARKIANEGTPAQKPLARTLWSDESESLISAIKQEIVKEVIRYITEQEIAE